MVEWLSCRKGCFDAFALEILVLEVVVLEIHVFDAVDWKTVILEPAALEIIV